MKIIGGGHQRLVGVNHEFRICCERIAITKAVRRSQEMKLLSFILVSVLSGCAMTPSTSSPEYTTSTAKQTLPLTAKQAMLLAVQHFDEEKFGPIMKYSISIHETPDPARGHIYLCCFGKGAEGEKIPLASTGWLILREAIGVA
jgi:hypothetical protein